MLRLTKNTILIYITRATKSYTHLLFVSHFKADFMFFITVSKIGFSDRQFLQLASRLGVH